MEQDFAVVKRDRFDLLDDSCYILQGTWPKESQAEVYLDKETIKAEICDWENTSALERFTDLDSLKNKKITMRIYLPKNVNKYKKLAVYGWKEGKRFLWFSISTNKLCKKMGKPQYYLEEVSRERGLRNCCIRGWMAYKEPVTVRILDLNHKEIPSQIEYSNRPDVVKMWFLYGTQKPSDK